MLPLLRVTLLGCVLIATLGFAAGFFVVSGTQPTLGRFDAPARGALLAQEHHPEWRQFLVQAALRRADELERLRALPEWPAPPANNRGPMITHETQRSARLPATGNDASPDDDATGSVSGPALNDFIPIDIGESSSTELPVGAPQTIPAPLQPQRLELPDGHSAIPSDKPALVNSGPAPAIAAPAARATAQAEPAKPRRAKPRGKRPVKPAQTGNDSPLATLFGIFEQKPENARAQPAQ